MFKEYNIDDIFFDKTQHSHIATTQKKTKLKHNMNKFNVQKKYTLNLNLNLYAYLSIVEIKFLKRRRNREGREEEPLIL